MDRKALRRASGSTGRRFFVGQKLVVVPVGRMAAVAVSALVAAEVMGEEAKEEARVKY